MQTLSVVHTSPAGGAEAGASGAPPSSEARRRSVMRICSAAACTNSSCGILAYLHSMPSKNLLAPCIIIRQIHI